MNTILLRPTDVLFFRDGRPMEGSLAGHGAAWPLPTVTDAALHAALHRSGLEAHPHRHAAGSGHGARERKFGCVHSVGPFPVQEKDGNMDWFFPRPFDLVDGTLQPGIAPAAGFKAGESSLPAPLHYAVGSALAPTKDAKAKGWLSRAAIECYIGADQPALPFGGGNAVNDEDIFDAEHTIGIGIDPETGTAGQGEAAGKIYSARYLRLRDEWRLGMFARAEDKEFHDPLHGNDLVRALFDGNSSHNILVGGQQRVCTAELSKVNGGSLPLPQCRKSGFKSKNGKHFVKWVLLTPAIWPEMSDGKSARRESEVAKKPHPGGWLPNWVDPKNGAVLLRKISAEERQRRRTLNYGGKGYRGEENADEISARLVAALVPKPLVVTGWALPGEEEGGAKPTLLAVPAGAVYYFEADSAVEAEKLASVLNWNGDGDGTAIRNRRSTVFGEKGFGIGVCGTWKFFEDVPGRSSNGNH
ncbi:MAG: type III-B CRISPR module-associated Cmr3 family protein [Chthoniobacteraceae bacterium]|jgi:CRISPR type III-B/RAMP module-associated protein Cmr3